MNFGSKNFGLLLCVVSPTFLMAGCPDAVYCAYGTCTGYYYDSLVSGLAYESRDADGAITHEGVTGEEGDPGRFSYAEGDTVSFSLGDVSLGESMAQPRVTPFDVAGLDEEAVGGCDVDGELPEDADAFRRVVNLAVLLQTLDSDGDHSTGIDISAEVAALFESATVDVDQARGAFQEDAGVQDVLAQANDRGLFEGTRALVSSEDALRALYVGLGLCPPES